MHQWGIILGLAGGLVSAQAADEVPTTKPKTLGGALEKVPAMKWLGEIKEDKDFKIEERSGFKSELATPSKDIKNARATARNKMQALQVEKTELLEQIQSRLKWSEKDFQKLTNHQHALTLAEAQALNALHQKLLAYQAWELQQRIQEEQKAVETAAQNLSDLQAKLKVASETRGVTAGSVKFDQQSKDLKTAADNLQRMDERSDLQVQFFLATRYNTTYGNGTSTGEAERGFFASSRKFLSAEFSQGYQLDYYGIPTFDTFARISFETRDTQATKAAEGFSGEFGASWCPTSLRHSKFMLRLFGSVGASSLPDSSTNPGIRTRVQDLTIDRRFAERYRIGFQLLQHNQAPWGKSFVDFALEKDRFYQQPDRFTVRGRLYGFKDLLFAEVAMNRSLHRGPQATDDLALTLGVPFKGDELLGKLKSLFTE